MIGKALIKGIWVLRWTAIIAALVYVGLNLVRTVRKALEGQVVVSTNCYDSYGGITVG